MAKKSNELTPLTIELVKRVLVGLYIPFLSGKDEQNVSEELAQESALSPIEALCLLAYADRAVTGSDVEYFLWQVLGDKRDAQILSETGVFRLLAQKHITFATASDKARLSRDKNHEVWGLPGTVRFTLTAKGARRIAPIVGTIRGIPYKDLIKPLQEDSKARAKAKVVK